MDQIYIPPIRLYLLCDCCNNDPRCCGLCYYCCPSEEPRECCPANLNIYCNSGYIKTGDGLGGKDACCTCFCFLPKLLTFFPCFLGSVLNECINCICCTNLNYLF